MLRILLFLFVVTESTSNRARPNIVLILTDDQDLLLQSMTVMDSVQQRIVDEGATFVNFFVNSPICCPSRSTILTGKYPHNTGVRNNSISGNCSSGYWQKYHEPRSFVSLLKTRANYTNFYAGKYLNTYGDRKNGGVKHVPDGYDWWIGLQGNSKYYNYTLSINGTGRHFTNEYLTDVMKNYALSFLNQQQIQRDPFFMMLATPACHQPFTPAPRHRHKFPDLKVLRTPSFNYSDDNRHWLIRMPPKYLPADVAIMDDIQRKRYQTLLAVDELVSEVVAKLDEISVLDDTYIMFTSDNGYHIGQFVQAWDKRQPYETDLRVPFFIRGPLIKSKRTMYQPVSTIDIAPTILSIAGIKTPNDMDGRSFYKNLVKGIDNKNGDILIEYHGESNLKTIDYRCPWVNDKGVSQCTLESWCKCQDSRNNTYACVRRFAPEVNFKFCKFFDEENFIEAYDLQSDPSELHNIYELLKSNDIGEYTKVINLLEKCSGKVCNG
ncbi:hypothetical protein RN001_010605 [Aquatica leii]|uniref:Sulfatase N-terminal domain-containing protein n=1 Tax=Aquatica leii TaxID=1421715 RepID=A0AAN7SG48_9COLE|nr:hypothetical protein RN001_010605 [Aquatica leii]